MSALDDWAKDDPKVKVMVAKLRPILAQEIKGSIEKSFRDGRIDGIKQCIGLAGSTRDPGLLLARLQRALEDA